MKHGGKRKGSGRKPIDDKAMQLTIYPKTSIVEKNGGHEKAKIVALAALIKNAAKN